MTVTVVTDSELGLDCVIGVYRGDAIAVEEELREIAEAEDEEFDESQIFHEMEL